MTEEEAAVIKEAANGINAKIRSFRADYTHQDDLDIALMACLDIMTELLRLKSRQQADTSLAIDSLSRLEEQLDQVLASSSLPS